MKEKARMDKTLIHQSGTIFYRVFTPASSGQTLLAGEPMNLAVPTDPISLVLLHGFAEDGRVWENQVNYLKARFPLLIPDLPGSGNSSPLSAATSMEEHADAILALLDAEQIGQAVLVGHSMGGYIALAFVEKYPERCKAFGLFHSTAYPDSEEKKTTRRKSMAFIARHGAAEFIRQSTPNLFADSSRERHPEWIRELIERYSTMDGDSLTHYYQAMIDRPDRSAVLAHSGLPVLLVMGGQDNTLPLEAGLRQSHLPSIAFIHILREAGHMGMIEAAVRSNEILEAFLTFNPHSL
jgi:pimeloyl-ACP methyl ester carboxylesterase